MSLQKFISLFLIAIFEIHTNSRSLSWKQVFFPREQRKKPIDHDFWNQTQQIYIREWDTSASRLINEPRPIETLTA